MVRWIFIPYLCGRILAKSHPGKHMTRPTRTAFPYRRFLLPLVFLLTASLTPLQSHAADPANGEALYKVNCASCHYMDRKFTGPALQGVSERWPDTANLYAWIKNSQAFLQTGDEYANALYKEYNNSVMRSFPALSDGDIADILQYIEEWQPPVVAETVGVGAGEEKGGSDNTLLWIILIALVAITFIVSRASRYLERMVAERYEEHVPEPIPFYRRKGMRPVLTLIMLAGVCLLGYVTYDGATALGRQEGYMPDQPIAFSHEIHAGINKINCKYCHVGVEKGKSAVIPSLNVCMNCHYSIREGAISGTAEISKIYDYVGFDPDENAYTGDSKPIEWVRIHNMPDHVYFNHAQHVKVGGIDCQVCHGQVEAMEVVYQAENLSMGFCINCHRETEVQFTENEFYAGYDELHRKLHDGEIDAVHVSDIGGTECQRCHY
jgi:mono/diheme cytochrome c family protein